MLSAHSENRVLYLEDDPDDALLLERNLAQIERYLFQVAVHRTSHSALMSLSFDQYDVVICDYFLRESNAEPPTSALFIHHFIEHHPDTPIIMTTGAEYLMADQATRQLITQGRLVFLHKSLWGPAILLEKILEAQTLLKGRCHSRPELTAPPHAKSTPAHKPGLGNSQS